MTPNIPEARALAGAGEEASQEELAREVLALGPQAVVVTGGHSERNVDLFFDGREAVPIEGERHPGGAAHGSGCTHSSALAARPGARRQPARGGPRSRGGSPRRPSAPACASSARAPARSTSSDSLGRARPDSASRFRR